MLLTHASDVDLLTTDVGVFNYSGALMILGNELMTTTSVTTVEATCAQQPPPFRYTPYRVGVNWTQYGSLGARLPADGAGRRVARGLRWWRCDAPTGTWKASALSDCAVPHSSAALAVTQGIAGAPGDTSGAPGVLLRPGSLVVTHVCAAGTYVLGAAPCSDGAPHGADCITCMEGWYGCACEFTQSTFGAIDPTSAAVAWLISALVALPYTVQALAVLFGCWHARPTKARPESAFVKTKYSLLNGARAFVHMAAGSLLVSRSIDLWITKPGHVRAYAAVTLAFAVVFLVLMVLEVVTRAQMLCAGRSVSPGRVPYALLSTDENAEPGSPGPERRADDPLDARFRVAAGSIGCASAVVYAIQSIAFAVYMDPRRGTLILTIVLECVFALLQVAHVLSSHDAVRADGPGNRAWLFALCVACAVFAFVYPMPLFEAPCAGSTTAPV